MADDKISEQIVLVRDFIAAEVEMRDGCGEEGYLQKASNAFQAFDQIVRAYRALKQEAV